MQNDPFSQFKAAQREGWALFVPLEAYTTPAAARLVDFARVQRGEKLLDVGCGTGVVAVTAARAGARVDALDLSPVLLERARWNAGTAGIAIEFTEGDVEALPYPDASFDVVLSQYGHMFAPRPEIAVAEMLRVLKPSGRIAFSTWPPELFIGCMFNLVGQYLPLPAGVPPVALWGDPNVVRERLADKVADMTFEREAMYIPALSPQHAREAFEATAAPVVKVVQTLKDDPERLARFRAELEALIATFTKGNLVRQQYLMTRATKLAS
ncbi:MAG: class I SAM-dependent methyltransferase [Gammaproteobacteria bacterium]|nr:class I SAM-dependent methyltransferase [Gammaproteobacteria bacterium]